VRRILADRGLGAGGEGVRLVVGRIGRAHGIKGEVTVEIRTDDPESRFAPGSVLITDPAQAGPLTITSSRLHAGRLLVSFEGTADRTAAGGLRGTMLLVEVDPDELPDDPDEYYDHQLVGLVVITVGGDSVGQVHQMLHLPGQDLFAVRRADGGETLIPFVAEIVPEVDVAAGRIVVDPPPGLIDLGQVEESR
jgi:16S rRNA processing protein RimM